MNAEFFRALDDLEREKGIPKEYMLERIEQALLTAYRRNCGTEEENAEVLVDREKKTIKLVQVKTVVETVENPLSEISVEEARKTSKKAVVGDVVKLELNTKQFGRIAAQTAKQVIIQGIRESGRGQMFDELASKEHEIVNGAVTRVDSRGNIFVELTGRNDQAEAFLPVSEQISSEVYYPGDKIKVYLVEVKKGLRGMQILVSRTHPGLVKRMFELEVPEIYDGAVEIKAIAREAGSRTKIAVWSENKDLDPIGACVGPRGARVNAIVSELMGEKIDILPWSEDTVAFVSAAIAPASVVSVEMLPEGKSCRMVVADDQLSLAIGREGQNVRLAAKLTGCKIDIKPQSQA
ncbi:MAG: transcription termination/antitermination protein NusA [Clostridia bacterium]|nr:transcription termination/antitermination protein NusA [Clostridia bacterium]